MSCSYYTFRNGDYYCYKKEDYYIINIAETIPMMSVLSTKGRPAAATVT